MYGDVLQVSISEAGNARVIRLSGELDSYSCERLGSVPESWIWGSEKVIVSLDGLEYIDSAGLSALVGLWVRAQEKGVQLIISCQKPRIHRVLEITGLLNLFSVDSSGPEARALISERYCGVMDTTSARATSLARAALRRHMEIRR